MAGIGFLGTVVTCDPGTPFTITHLTDIRLNVSGGETTQIVADQVAPLARAQAAVKGVTFSFAVPATGGATLLENLENQEQFEVQIEFKDAVGGSTLATWTSSDSACTSQGVSVQASGQGFLIATCNVSTNGGAWT